MQKKIYKFRKLKKKSISLTPCINKLNQITTAQTKQKQESFNLNNMHNPFPAVRYKPLTCSNCCK